MAFVIKKSSKYMTGHGYATGYGESFSWSTDLKCARRFAVAEQAEGLRQLSRGTFVEVPSTRQEPKEAGRIAMMAQARQAAPARPRLPA